VLSVPAFLGWTALMIVAVLTAGAVAGWLIAEMLNERDRRRLAACPPPQTATEPAGPWSSSTPTSSAGSSVPS
jgi:hypothetical protein